MKCLHGYLCLDEKPLIRHAVHTCKLGKKNAFFRVLKISGKIFSRRYELFRDSQESILVMVVCKFFLLVFSGGSTKVRDCRISKYQINFEILILSRYFDIIMDCTVSKYQINFEILILS